MTKYSVRVDGHEYTISAPDPEDNWDNGEYGMDITLTEIKRGDGFMDPVREYDLVYGADDIPAGDIANVVLVKYQTGDTFGSNHAWTICAIKSDVQEAHDVVKKCHGENDTGKFMRQWDGYFEHLLSATVVPLVMQAE